ncbi:MAG: hypothetical protein DM484_05490 [Candidatus Methylumidiphilus alinenensis]|uniref:N-formylglutamate amidohydrolase n=1 Tax=Candidatus Methylumidiphilus alinenensis TaxID=2202197 RepID=A0A2W4RGP1_9GAMM|nr:MAG: hypothetical protein DM484_05490 [Candidatus Methylumidiphilus alinenensis]
MQIEKTLSDTQKNLLLISGEINDVVIGVPHHAPLGVTNLPCKEHPDADENAGYLGYEIACLLNCNCIIACNYDVNPNGSEDTEYSKKILSWMPKFLIEIHGHGGKSAKFDIEISSGSEKNNNFSLKLAEYLRLKFSGLPLLKQYTISGDFKKIHFKATRSFTIQRNEWISYHIELPKSIRQSKEEYLLFCKYLAEAVKELLLLS